MTNQTMMETATQPEGSPASQAPESVSATADKLYGNTQKATPDQQATPASTEKAPVATDTKSAEAPADAKTTVPETYEFTVPEGRTYDSEVMAEYSKVAKELNLSQEAAQRVLDAVGSKAAERQQAQVEAVRTEWETTSKADKEFGGEKLNENLSVAKKALDAFGTTELRTLLNESGLGNHPELIRFMFRAGKAISEDRVITGSAGQTKIGPKSFSDMADALYSNT